MKPRTLILPAYDQRVDLWRWALCGLIVVAAHAGLVGSYLLLAPPPEEGSPQGPSVIIELAPLPVAPNSPVDLAPGPEMVESPAQTQQQTPTEPEKAEPMPSIQAPAEVTLPPPVEKPVEKRQVEEPEVKKPDATKAEEMAPAPVTTANPRSDQQVAPVARAPSPGSAESNAAIQSWRSLMVARLQQAKRYPATAEARREQGVVTLSFSVDRNGRVLSRHIAKSSGHASLDEEVLALVMRAQPLPPFPPAMTQAIVNLAVPIRFSLR
jgi:protein TonB